MSQASTAAVAVVTSVNVPGQPDPLNESPYPKWSTSPSAQDGFQGKHQHYFSARNISFHFSFLFFEIFMCS